MQAIADTRFDLSIVRYSLAVDIIGYSAMAILVPAPVFVLLTCLVTFGSCTSPASNSLALNLVDSSRDTGRLFGGLAVVTGESIRLMNRAKIADRLIAYTTFLQR